MKQILQKGSKTPAFTTQKSLRGSKINEFTIIDRFKYGYRNREDQTNLPAGVLVPGSNNVLTNVSERIQCRKGYTLDGSVSTTITPITCSYTLDQYLNFERNLRGYLPTASTGVLEYRYVDPTTGAVTWRTLLSGLTSTSFNFSPWWYTNELQGVVLGVNGTANIYEWGGGITEIASVTSNTLTKTGTTSWKQESFYNNGTDHATRKVTINGIDYTYTGGETTTTLTGVTPNPIISTTDQSQTTQDGSVEVGEQDVTTKKNKIAQSFIAGQTNITGVKLFKIANTGTFTGDVTIDLLSDVAGSPSNVLATVTIANATYNALPAAEFTATFGTAYTSAVVGTKYWIYVETSTSDTSNHPNLGTNTAGGYTSGSVKYYDTADGWTDIATIDLYFKTLYSVVANDIVHQTPIVTATGSITALNLSTNDLISTYGGRLFLGCKKEQLVYVSKVNDYLDFTTDSINRTGYGTTIFLDAPPVSINTLENSITMSAGKNQWYQTQLTQGLWTDHSNPAAPVEYQTDIWTTNRLKTNSRAAAQSQAMVSAMKNDLIFISNEPTLDRLGRVESILGSTQTTNISDPIKLDFDVYDFTDASIFYNKYFIYLSVPKSGLVLIYNIVKAYWEAPQTIPICRFYTVNGELYGHSYLTPESYKLFDGRADRVDPVTNPLGNPIPCKVVLSYNNYGSSFNSKNFNKFYVEGYISSNTSLTLGIKYDIDGCATTTSYQILGNNPQYVCLASDNSSLGKSPLGKNPLGGNLNTPQTLPPKFRVIKTFPKTDFYEVQYSFESVAINSNWEILRLGPALEFSPTIPTDIVD